MAFAVRPEDVDVVGEAVEQRHNGAIEVGESLAGTRRTRVEGVGKN